MRIQGMLRDDNEFLYRDHPELKNKIYGPNDIPPNDVVVAFNRYLMNESLAPKNTPYGINDAMNDRHYMIDGDSDSLSK